MARRFSRGDLVKLDGPSVSLYNHESFDERGRIVRPMTWDGDGGYAIYLELHHFAGIPYYCLLHPELGVVWVYTLWVEGV